MYRGAHAHSFRMSMITIIPNHSACGPQILTLRFVTNDGAAGQSPFTVLNPSQLDDPRLSQTTSVVRVRELHPSVLGLSSASARAGTGAGTGSSSAGWFYLTDRYLLS